MSDEETAFAEFKNLVRVHLKQILKLDTKPPVFTVALLVAVACEQISNLIPSEGSAERVFSKALIEPHGISARVGCDLFDVVRNGLAHSYMPKMLQIGEEIVGTTFAWKGEHHLRVLGIKIHDGRNWGVPVERNETPHRWLRINAESLWRDLDTYLSDLETRLNSGQIAFDVDAMRLTKGPISGSAADEWRAFLTSRELHEGRA